eukprot:1157161-Pelagomonas_calceolata.AAC.5
MEEIINSSSGGGEKSCQSLKYHLRQSIDFGVISLELSYCDNMGLVQGCTFMDPIGLKAHQGLHYAAYEGGEVVGRWLMPGEGFVNEF